MASQDVCRRAFIDAPEDVNPSAWEQGFGSDSHEVWPMRYIAPVG